MIKSILITLITLFTALTPLTAWAEVDVNVTSFGALCDGTTDDTAAIQAALNFAGTNAGGVVRFPAARIRLNGRVLVPDQVDLMGAGITATTILCTSSTSGDCLQRQPRPHAKSAARTVGTLRGERQQHRLEPRVHGLPDGVPV